MTAIQIPPVCPQSSVTPKSSGPMRRYGVVRRASVLLRNWLQFRQANSKCKWGLLGYNGSLVQQAGQRCHSTRSSICTSGRSANRQGAEGLTQLVYRGETPPSRRDRPLERRRPHGRAARRLVKGPRRPRSLRRQVPVLVLVDWVSVGVPGRRASWRAGELRIGIPLLTVVLVPGLGWPAF